MSEQRELTKEQWEAEGEAKFGDNKLDWKFVCPACGHIASVKDWTMVGGSRGAAANCVGRYLEKCRDAFGETGPGPCNFAGGGLIDLRPVSVDGVRCFEFSE